MQYVTYKLLLKWLKNMTKEQLESNVTYYDAATDTYVPIENMVVADDDVVADQPVLVINDRPRPPYIVD